MTLDQVWLLLSLLGKSADQTGCYLVLLPDVFMQHHGLLGCGYDARQLLGAQVFSMSLLELPTRGKLLLSLSLKLLLLKSFDVLFGG